MKTPFTYGKLVLETDFTNRIVETKRLISNFNSSVNTVLISPRRWGKSSLVAKAADKIQTKSKKIVFCMIDLNNIRSEEQFYKLLATKVLQQSSTKVDAILENAKLFLGSFIPNISFSPNPETDLKLSLDWNEVKKEPDDILDLAEKIAVRTKKKIIICIDEFQNISEFDYPVDFQKKLRAHWQLHQHVTYTIWQQKTYVNGGIQFSLNAIL